MGVTFRKMFRISELKVVDLVKELMDYSIHVHVIDPNGSPMNYPMNMELH
jgi:hypothetical protein